MRIANGGIPVQMGRGILEVCDKPRAEALAKAANVEVIRCRQTGEIVRLLVKEVPQKARPDNEASQGQDSSLRLTYSESYAGRDVVVLKRYDPEYGFFRWSDRDSFNPKRFNPDRVAGPSGKKLSGG